MAEQNLNPFENEKPKIVHLEKSESHYEYCRMQMHDIEKIHRRTFICNLALCIVVCFFSIFKKYIAMFDLLSRPYLELDRPEAILTGGIFQILFGMLIIVLGYLAWANYRTLNIILWAWYVMSTLIGIFRLDYLSAMIGIVGAVFYFFSVRELRHEQALAQMEGYPDFQEKLDISKSDIVIQTLLAHQGERRTKSTLFTTDYSLRRKKKKKGSFGYEEPEKDKAEEAGNALVAALQKGIQDVRNAEHEKAEAKAESAVSAQADGSDESAAPAGMEELIPAEAPEQADTAPVQTDAVPEQTDAALTQADASEQADTAPALADKKPENIKPERADAEAAAAAILAEAEARTQKILAEAEAKAKALTEHTPAEQKPNQQPNPNRKKKKRR